MFKKLIYKLNKKNGASMIEFVFSMLLFILLLSSGVEFFLLGYKYISVSSYANGLAQTISKQGGVQTSTPNGYSGGSLSYKTSSDIINNLDELATITQQDISDIKITINYQENNNSALTSKVLTSSSNIEIPYGNRFEVVVECPAKFSLMNNLLEMVGQEFRLKRTKGEVSQFEHDYNAYN